MILNRSPISLIKKKLEVGLCYSYELIKNLQYSSQNVILGERYKVEKYPQYNKNKKYIHNLYISLQLWI